MIADLRLRRHLLSLLCLIGVAGCASSLPPRRLIVVPSVPIAASASAPSLGGPSALAPTGLHVVVGVVSVPEQLQHREVRYQGDMSVLKSWPDAIWAERIEVGLTRRLSQALYQASPAQGWWTHEEEQAQARLLVDIQQLDIDPAQGRLSAMTRWGLVTRQGVTLASGSVRSQRVVVVHSAADQAMAMGEWVDGMAQEIVNQLSQSALKLSGKLADLLER